MHSRFLRLALALLLVALAFVLITRKPAGLVSAESNTAPDAATNWVTNGNALAAGAFLGSKNGQPLIFKTNNKERMRIDKYGYVGIGVANSTYPLTVAGSIKLTDGGYYFADGTAQGTAFNPSKYVNRQGDAMTGPLYLASNGLFLGTNQLVANGGNVGIGTATPDTKLVIQTASAKFGWKHTDGTIKLASYVGTGLLGATGGWLGTLSNNDLQLFTNDVPRMTVATNGDVGIGTLHPQVTLDVNGDIRGQSLSSPYALNLQAGQNYGINFTTVNGQAHNDRMVILNNGNVGIGTTNPQLSLDVNGSIRTSDLYGAGTLSLLGGPNLGIRFLTGDGQLYYSQMVVLNNGHVGIGTTTPSTNLTVRGPDSSAGTTTFNVQNSSAGDALWVLDNATVGIFTNATTATAPLCQDNTYIVRKCASAAEYAPSIDGGEGYPETADLVSIAPSVSNPYADAHSPFSIQKSSTPCDTNLLGFIVDPEKGAAGIKVNEHYLPLAIYGYFPAKVSIENGAIHRGDPLTSSSKAGYAMKATSACKTIGYALEDANAEGTIQVFSHLSEYSAAQVASLQGQVDALKQENDTLKQGVTAVKQENDSLKQELAAIDARLNALEQASSVAASTSGNVDP